jgi:hypothetical protein
MEISLAIAQGFHNAPRLYGDDTVRRPTRINGFHSGLKAAGEEFIYGIYDGWTGVVLQPYRGAKRGGPVGFVKGVGKGVGGFVLKDLAALFGPFGYTLKGIHKELQKGRQPTRFIQGARIIQGQQDLHALNEAERKSAIDAVERGWLIVLELHRFERQKKASGLKGRIEIYRERKHWHEHGAFENVRQAGKALDAQKKGHSFDKVFSSQRKEFRAAAAPKKSTMTKAQRQGKAWKEKEEQEKKDGEEVEWADGHTGTAVADQAARHPQVGGVEGMAMEPRFDGKDSTVRNGGPQVNGVQQANGVTSGVRRLS